MFAKEVPLLLNGEPLPGVTDLETEVACPVCLGEILKSLGVTTLKEE